MQRKRTNYGFATGPKRIDGKLARRFARRIAATVIPGSQWQQFPPLLTARHGRLGQLASLELGANRLVVVGGELSSRLRVLDVSSNGLSGNLPNDLYSLVEELDISHNKITGPLSTQIGQLVRLQRLKCFGNELSGGLPTQLWSISDISWQPRIDLPVRFRLLSTISSMSR